MMRHYRYEYEAKGPNGETVRSGGFGSFLNEFQLRLFLPSFHSRFGLRETNITSVAEITEEELTELKKKANKQ